MDDVRYSKKDFYKGYLCELELDGSVLSLTIIAECLFFRLDNNTFYNCDDNKCYELVMFNEDNRIINRELGFYVASVEPIFKKETGKATVLEAYQKYYKIKEDGQNVNTNRKRRFKTRIRKGK